MVGGGVDVGHREGQAVRTGPGRRPGARPAPPARGWPRPAGRTAAAARSASRCAGLRCPGPRSRRWCGRGRGEDDHVVDVRDAVRMPARPVVARGAGGVRPGVHCHGRRRPVQDAVADFAVAKAVAVPSRRRPHPPPPSASATSGRASVQAIRPRPRSSSAPTRRRRTVPAWHVPSALTAKPTCHQGGRVVAHDDLGQPARRCAHPRRRYSPLSTTSTGSGGGAPP